MLRFSLTILVSLPPINGGGGVYSPNYFNTEKLQLNTITGISLVRVLLK